MSHGKKIPQSAFALASMILDSQLLDQETIRSLLTAFEASGNGNSAAAFAEFLVVQDALTKWQCGKLCNGQWKGFIVDHYRFDDHIGNDATHARYAATDLRSGQRVTLAFQPFPRPPKYTVETFGRGE